MKRKIILIILILILGLWAWRVFVINFSQGPIEIIPENSKKLPTDEKKISEISDSLKNPQDKPKEDDLPSKIDKNKPSQNDQIETENEPEKIKIEEKATSETKNTDDFIINKKVSWGYSSTEGRVIDTIVIHSSYDALGSEPYSLEGLIAEYKQYSVAPHFLIDRQGKIYRLVDEKNIAHHAGISKNPDGRTGVNDFSIGIEMMNTEEGRCTSKQYSGLNDLIDYLENNYKIKYVLGHYDISPDRKTDPWNFDWKEVNSKNTIH